MNRDKIVKMNSDDGIIAKQSSCNSRKTFNWGWPWSLNRKIKIVGEQVGNGKGEGLQNFRVSPGGLVPPPPSLQKIFYPSHIPIGRGGKKIFG